MVGFFIKKAFFDGWDNLMGLVLFNLVYIVLMFAGVWAFFTLIQLSAAAAVAAFALVLLIYAVISGGTAAVVLNYSNYRRDSWSAFRTGIVRNIRHSLLFFVIMLFCVLNVLFIIPFYISSGNVLGYVAVVIMIWIEVFVVLGIPYFFPLMNLLPGDRPLKTLNKCLIIIGDNPGFTLFFALYRLFVTAVSVFTMGLCPGVAGAQLAGQDAMKLLMFKYDWLEENKNADRRHIPWADLLYDEKEKVGPRTLKNMIFPWK